MQNSYISYPGQSLPWLLVWNLHCLTPAVVKLASDQIPRMPKSLNDQAWPRCEPESTSVFELSPVLREYSADLVLKAEALYWPWCFKFCYRNKKPCSVLYNLRLEFQCMCPIILFGPKHSENFCSVGGNLRPVTISWVPFRGGMGPIFLSPSRARALSIELE